MSGRPTVPQIRARKVRDGAEPLVMVTAHDAPTARIADAGGVDMILVGDSLAMVALGYPDTLSVTIDDMVHHTAAVSRAQPEALVVGDLPWMSYHTGRHDAVRNAASLVRAGAQSVKLEGGAKRVSVIDAIVDAEIPVMGHLGLTPQSMHALGGFRVQAKASDAALALVDEAKALEHAGCFAIVLEAIPDVVADLVTESVGVPTIGIGAGAGTDGQVLVLSDLLGLDPNRPPKFVRRYADGYAMGTDAVARYVADVRSGAFPSDAETYHASEATKETLAIYGGA
ncbi:MAG: 3-methyl-2-oxobutanoate hydroxymethyltransferase [Microthrixaceae bacterium]